MSTVSLRALSHSKCAALRWCAGALLALAVLVTGTRDASAQTKPVLVFAAASLKEWLDEASAAFTAQTGIAVTISYAATSQLARQIQNGAPAHLFIAADTQWMDELARTDHIDTASRLNLLGNRLVVIAPRDSTHAPFTLTRETDLAALLGDGRLALAQVESVPAGRYAKAALEKLGQWDRLRTRLAMADHVRAALVLVARGEAPLGIVYASDAMSEPRVKILAPVSGDMHPPIIYPAALVLYDGGTDARATRVLAYLRAQAPILAPKYGFATPSPPERKP